METKYKILIGIVVAILIGLIGFFIGRKTIKVEEKTVIEYVTLDPIHDTIVKIEPSSEMPPIDTLNIIRQCIKDGIYGKLFPYKVIYDTIHINTTSEDTLRILTDWSTQRYYCENLFNIDTIGSCDVKFKVQYNRLDSLSYTYVPTQKSITITKEKVKSIEPFIGVSVMSNPSIGADFGLYIKEHYGVSVMYNYGINEKKHTFGCAFNYKF